MNLGSKQKKIDSRVQYSPNQLKQLKSQENFVAEAEKVDRHDRQMPLKQLGNSNKIPVSQLSTTSTTDLRNDKELMIPQSPDNQNQSGQSSTFHHSANYSTNAPSSPELKQRRSSMKEFKEKGSQVEIQDNVGIEQKTRTTIGESSASEIFNPQIDRLRDHAQREIDYFSSPHPPPPIIVPNQHQNQMKTSWVPSFDNQINGELKHFGTQSTQYCISQSESELNLELHTPKIKDQQFIKDHFQMKIVYQEMEMELNKLRKEIQLYQQAQSLYLKKGQMLTEKLEQNDYQLIQTRIANEKFENQLQIKSDKLNNIQKELQAAVQTLEKQDNEIIQLKQEIQKFVQTIKILENAQETFSDRQRLAEIKEVSSNEEIGYQRQNNYQEIIRELQTQNEYLNLQIIQLERQRNPSEQEKIQKKNSKSYQFQEKLTNNNNHQRNHQYQNQNQQQNINQQKKLELNEEFSSQLSEESQFDQFGSMSKSRKNSDFEVKISQQHPHQAQQVSLFEQFLEPIKRTLEIRDEEQISHEEILDIIIKKVNFIEKVQELIQICSPQHMNEKYINEKQIWRWIQNVMEQLYHLKQKISNYNINLE